MCICKNMVNDFIRSAATESGAGCFEGIETAARLAQSLGTNSLQKFRRYDIVPRKFFQCLHEVGILDAAQVPNRGVNIATARVILAEAGLRERLPKKLFQDFKLYLQSASQEHLWRRGEEMARLNEVWLERLCLILFINKQTILLYSFGMISHKKIRYFTSQ